MLLLV
jgi:hypothetical protein